MRYCFLFILAVQSCLYCSVPEVSSEEIDVKNFEIVKKTKKQGHTVYFDNHQYYKIWDKESWHFQNNQNIIFLEAVRSGFFEGIAPLQAVIMENGQCIGYITSQCNPVGHFTYKIQSLTDLQENKDLPNHHLVVELFRLYKDSILNTGFCFFGDFQGTWNMGILGSKCYYFDLDRIAILSEYMVERPEHSSRMLFVLDGDF